MEGWTNPAKSCSLLSFRAHFLLQSTRQKVVLAAMVLEENHTGAHLASTLTGVLLTCTNQIQTSDYSAVFNV